MNQTSQAVENALKSEKTFCRVDFAITGDFETDMIAGVVAAIEQAWKSEPLEQNHAYRMAQRVCLYLAARYESYAVQGEKQQESFRQMSQQAQKQWSASSGTSIANNPNPNLAGIQPYQVP